ncbi:MAG: hypothetical protein V1926_03810 [Candidatus Peregrinibacteria bacterium]
MRFSFQHRFLSVAFFASAILLVETVLFHVFNYMHGYFIANMVIYYAVVGIGIGAFLASRLRISDQQCFLFCVTGMTVLLYVTAIILVLYPAVWLLSLLTPCTFIFPVLFITRSFENYESDNIYLYDMVGAGLGVILTVLLFSFLLSEEIILFLLIILPLVGFLSVRLSKERTQMRWWGRGLAVLSIVAVVLLGAQLTTDSLNFCRIVNRSFTGFDRQKNFYLFSPTRLVKSYDSLAGRLDVFSWRTRHTVLNHGLSNDVFSNGQRSDYAELQKKGVVYPTKDVRVLYGPVKEPRVFIIGSSAEGIIKVIRRITPLQNITPKKHPLFQR